MNNDRVGKSVARTIQFRDTTDLKSIHRRLAMRRGKPDKKACPSLWPQDYVSDMYARDVVLPCPRLSGVFVLRYCTACIQPITNIQNPISSPVQNNDPFHPYSRLQYATAWLGFSINLLIFADKQNRLSFRHFYHFNPAKEKKRHFTPQNVYNKEQRFDRILFFRPFKHL